MNKYGEMIGNRVLIKEFPAAEKTAGGLYLPGNTGVPWRGVVVSVGPGEYSADLAREAVASANKEVEIAKQAAEVGDADGLVKSLAANARAVTEAAEGARAAELESRGLTIPMQVQEGDVVLYQSGIWANSMKVNLDGLGEFLMIRENYIGMIRHKAGTPEAIAAAQELGI